MSFTQKTWKDRISEHPNRRTLTDVSNNTTITVDVAREEGTISQEGDPYSSANMNDLESRIANGFSTLSQDSLKMSTANPSSDSIRFGINASGQYGYIKQGASEVTPFRNPTGNASPSDVLSGKTFSTASLENASGTRVDLGSEPEMKGGTLYNGDVYLYPVSGGDGRDYGIRRGVHASPSNIAGWSGGTLFTRSQYDSNYSSGYNNGVRDADNRANASSTNYKSGYNAGYSAGKASVVSKSITVTIPFQGNYGKPATTTYNVGHTILAAGVKEVHFGGSHYDPTSNANGWHSSAYTACTFSGTSFTVNVKTGTHAVGADNGEGYGADASGNITCTVSVAYYA